MHSILRFNFFFYKFVDFKSRHFWGVGGHEMNQEIGIDIYTQLCVNQITNESLLHSTRVSIPSRGPPGGPSGREPALPMQEMEETQVPPWVGKIRWRRAWQPALVFLLGGFHGQRSLAGCSP